MLEIKDEDDINLTVKFNAKRGWWDSILYKCEVYKRPVTTKPCFKGFVTNYISSRIKLLTDIKAERGQRVLSSITYNMGMSSKWSKEKLDEAIEYFVNNILEYKKGNKRVIWRDNT